MTLPLTAALAAALLAGCEPAHRDATAPGGDDPDGEGPGGGDGDGDGVEPDETCEPPMLLFGVRDYGEDDLRIARYSLAGGGPSPCTELRAAVDVVGPIAIAAIEGDRIAIAAAEEVVAIDVATGREIWTRRYSTPGNHRLRGACVWDDRLLVAVEDVVEVGWLESFDIDSGQVAAPLDVGDGVTDVACDPIDRTRLVEMQKFGDAATLRNPTTGASDILVGDQEALFDTVAVSTSAPRQLVWTGHVTDEEFDRESGVFTSDGAAMNGPLHCDAAERTYEDAVPDPMRPGGVYAIASISTAAAVLRFAPDSSCQTLATTDDLGDIVDVIGLAISP